MPQFPKSNYSTGQSSGIFVKAQGSHTPMVEADLPPPIILPEYYHPFKVYKPVFEGQSINFSLFVGQVYGKGPESTDEEPGVLWSPDENNLRVKIGASISTIPGSSTIDSNYLDERNVGMRYEADLDSTHDNVLYVVLKGRTDGQFGITAELELKSVEDAKQEYENAPPDCEYIEAEDELFQENVFHSIVSAPTNPFVINDVAIGNETSDIELNQRWDVYTNKIARSGNHYVPIAYIRQVDANWTVRQVLRSDIFFPHGASFKIFYIDTFTDSFYAGCGS